MPFLCEISFDENKLNATLDRGELQDWLVESGQIVPAETPLA